MSLSKKDKEEIYIMIRAFYEAERLRELAQKSLNANREREEKARVWEDQRDEWIKSYYDRINDFHQEQGYKVVYADSMDFEELYDVLNKTLKTFRLFSENVEYIDVWSRFTQEVFRMKKELKDLKVEKEKSDSEIEPFDVCWTDLEKLKWRAKHIKKNADIGLEILASRVQPGSYLIHEVGNPGSHFYNYAEAWARLNNIEDGALIYKRQNS